jgi:hypothetical protein
MDDWHIFTATAQDGHEVPCYLVEMNPGTMIEWLIPNHGPEHHDYYHRCEFVDATTAPRLIMRYFNECVRDALTGNY